MSHLSRYPQQVILSLSIAAVLCLSIVYSLPTQAESSQPNWFEKVIRRFQRPRDIGTAPGENQSGANVSPPGPNQDIVNRGCRKTAHPLTAFVPDSTSGRTHLSHPTFWFYVPHDIKSISSSVKAGEPVQFILTEAVERGPEIEIYQQSYALPANPDTFFSIKLPETVPGLEFNKQYRWTLAVYCQENNSSGAATVTGSIERVKVSSDWQNRLRSATTLEEELRLYYRKNLWYDMVDTVAERHQDHPTDSSVTAAWDYILGAVYLCSLSTVPPAAYCF